MAEGVNDALISLEVLGGFLVTASYNITTHMSFSATFNGVTNSDGGGPANDQDQYRVHRGNLVWLRPALLESQNDLVSQQTVNNVARQLFISLADSVLGLGPDDDNLRFVLLLGVFQPRP